MNEVGNAVQPDSVISGQPIQILIYNNESKQFDLNITELRAILNSSDVRDANISVVSIAGAFRKGKSLMLSFFLRYLNETYINNNEDWLGNEDTQLSGFPWRCGFERHTTGIWVWSKIFTKDLLNGEKIGIMLMDTQGTFDNSSRMHDNVTIFSLSVMLSSIQIFNLFNHIQTDDLQHLQLFTEYGKLALKQNDEKAFQTLLFLVRDWCCPYQAQYGFTGGRKLLEGIFEVTLNQDEELNDIRNHLKSCYEKLDCFLMPSPGKTAVTSPNFNGQLKDIEKEFKDMLKELVPALLAPEKIVPKKTNGVTLTGKTILIYLESYWKIFSSGDLPPAKSILNATSEANALAAKAVAIEFYHSEMNNATGNETAILQFDEVMDLHKKISEQSLEMFRSKAIIGDEHLKMNYYKELKDTLLTSFMPYLGQNEAKRVTNLNETIANLSAQMDEYRLQNTDLSAVVEQLLAEMASYRQLSDAEKENLQTQLEESRNLNITERERFDAEMERYRELNEIEQQRLQTELAEIIRSNNDSQSLQIETNRNTNYRQIGLTALNVGLTVASFYFPFLKFLKR